MHTVSEKDRDHPHNNTLSAPSDFTGPGTDRKCTDVFFALLLIAMWVATTIIGIDSICEGDVAKLLNGVDYDGRTCGVSEGVEDKSKLYYLDDDTGVCVSECPSVADDAGIDTTSCYCKDDVDMTSWSDDDTSYAASCAEEAENHACLYKVDTVDILGYCMWTSAVTAADDSLTDQLNGAGDGEDVDYIAEAFHDIYVGRDYVFGFGFVIAAVFGFLYLYMLRIPGVLTLTVWFSILLVLALGFAAGGGMYDQAEAWKSENPSTHENYEINGMYGLAVTALVLSCVWFFVMICMWKRISLAIGLVKAAAKAVMAMPLIILFPVVQLFGLVLYLIPWTIYAVYLASLGDVEEVCCAAAEDIDGGTTFECGASFEYCTGDDATDFSFTYSSFVYSEKTEYSGWLLLFSWFWTSQFIVAIGELTVAMAIAKWYFTRDKEGDAGSHFVRDAFKTVMKNHMGTAAFGSLIIAIVKMIRSFLAYMQRTAEKSGNRVAKVVLCMLQCCMWCIEKCLRFVNKNAYIQTAIFGTNFCTSAKAAFFLIARNIARIAAVTVVSGFVLVIGKCFITVLAAGSSYHIMRYMLEDEIYSPAAPTVFVAVLAWFTACMFTSVFDMAIATLLQCFIADEEMFDESARFAQGDLKEWVDANGAHPEDAEKPTPMVNKI